MKPQTFPAWIINLMFVVGLASALLFRLLIFFNYYYTTYARTVWYTAVIGYIFFFGFRFYISHKRRKIILENNLIHKVSGTRLDSDDKEALSYILQSIIKSKEMINYIFIFIVSGLAILLDVALMLFSTQ